MATDLWTKFKGAVRWAGETFGRAAIATIKASPEASLAELLAAASADNGAPGTGDAGISVQGFATVDLGFIFSVTAEAATFRFYLGDGTDWYTPEADKTVTAQTGETNVYIEPLDVESWDRLYARLITPPTSGTVAAKAGPYNDES